MPSYYYEEQFLQDKITVLSDIASSIDPIYNKLKSKAIDVRQTDIRVQIYGKGDIHLGQFDVLRDLYATVISEQVYTPDFTNNLASLEGIKSKATHSSLIITKSLDTKTKSGLIIIDSSVVESIINLKTQIDLLEPLNKDYYRCTDAKGEEIVISPGIGFVKPLTFAIFAYEKATGNKLDAFILTTPAPEILPEINNLKSKASFLDMSNTQEPDIDDEESTGINLKEKDSRDLIDTLAKIFNSISSSISVILSSLNNIEAGTYNNVIILQEVLGTVINITRDTNNIIFNMNVRFRNISLTEDEDDVFNLSTWLFAFQKQIMTIVYGQLIDIYFENKSTGEIEQFNLSAWLFAFQKQITTTLYDQLTDIFFENKTNGLIERFNLSTWLFAFQKQITTTLYDEKEKTDIIRDKLLELEPTILNIAGEQLLIKDEISVKLNELESKISDLDTRQIIIDSKLEMLQLTCNQILLKVNTL